MTLPLKRAIILRALQIISARTRRARETEAVDKDGKPCDPCAPEAVRFCAVGALIKAAYEITGQHERAHALGWKIAGQIAEHAALSAGEDEPAYAITVLSDTRGQKAVITLFTQYLHRP